ncbi:hypothetical protein CKO28_17275 [Rhodovibrio sodomensis]|uniref:Uncharacterized protein n=1 Tax=Rhodovibrio sodomensis TaxID=1088 RepID=A0ABS1DIG4_9PROT|nr:hypothetical protein [Rhodovibrio sodomensis]MBK1669791.1 hypothetical protein [Rhodovibrio sodomensis]
MTCSARFAALAVAALWSGLAAAPANAHGIEAETGNADPAFDIVRAEVTAEDDWLTFRMSVAGTAGARRPEPAGDLGGAPVYSYVWPTKLDTARVGFGQDLGILAFAVTSHPDFDDTPLFDENGDGDPDNDGRAWHSHWVVLVPAEEACGGGLKVKDIPDGAEPELPATWPGLPIYIDSPGYDPSFSDDTVTVRVPFQAAPQLKGVAFDGVTSGLRVNEQVHAPLLCVEDVFDVASGDLSLPGTVD